MRTSGPDLKSSFTRTANTFKYCYEQAIRRLLTIHVPTFFTAAGKAEIAAASGSIVSMGCLDFEGCAILAQHVPSSTSQLEYDVLRSSLRVLQNYAALMKWGQSYCDTKILTGGLRVVMEIASIAAFKKAGGNECWCGCEYDSLEQGEQMEAVLSAAFEEERTCQMADMVDGTRGIEPKDLDPDMPDLREVERTIRVKNKDKDNTRRGRGMDLAALKGMGLPVNLVSLLGLLKEGGSEVLAVPEEVASEVFGEEPPKKAG